MQIFYEQTVHDGLFKLESGYAKHLAKVLIGAAGKKSVEDEIELDPIAPIAVKLFYEFLNEGNHF